MMRKGGEIEGQIINRFMIINLEYFIGFSY